VPITINDDYDRRAYEQLLADLSKGPSVASRASGRVGNAVGSVAKRAMKSLPTAATDRAERVIRGALGGLRAVTLEPALRSVSHDRVVRAFRREGHSVHTAADIRRLPLRTIDEVMPSLRWRYSLGTALEGAGAGLVITGAEALTTAGSVASAGAAAAPGAGTVLAAMALDAAAVLAASARVIAHTAAYYGYNTREPEEELFALSVISWSSATTETAKYAAFQQLSRITQQLARSATWAQLSQHAMVNVIEEIYIRLGFRLTQRKLGQVIPVAGIAIGAGLNASLLHSIGSDARQAYRARHLSDRYGFRVEDLIHSPAAASTGRGLDAAIDIDRIIEIERGVEEPPEPDSDPGADDQSLVDETTAKINSGSITLPKGM
jgi:hypothetical protein